jgi:hypothetical protein
LKVTSVIKWALHTNPLKDPSNKNILFSDNALRDSALNELGLSIKPEPTSLHTGPIR